jgi:hypothetical protein
VRSSARYTRLLAEILDAASATQIPPDAGPQLIGETTQAPRNAIATEPRDLTPVRERVAEFGRSRRLCSALQRTPLDRGPAPV